MNSVSRARFFCGFGVPRLGLLISGRLRPPKDTLSELTLSNGTTGLPEHVLGAVHRIPEIPPLWHCFRSLKISGFFFLDSMQCPLFTYWGPYVFAPRSGRSVDYNWHYGPYQFFSYAWICLWIQFSGDNYDIFGMNLESEILISQLNSWNISTSNAMDWSVSWTGSMIRINFRHLFTVLDLLD